MLRALVPVMLALLLLTPGASGDAPPAATDEVTLARGQTIYHEVMVENPWDVTLRGKLENTVYRCADTCPWVDVASPKDVDLEPGELVTLEFRIEATLNTETGVHHFDVWCENENPNGSTEPFILMVLDVEVTGGDLTTTVAFYLVEYQACIVTAVLLAVAAALLIFMVRRRRKGRRGENSNTDE